AIQRTQFEIELVHRKSRPSLAEVGAGVCYQKIDGIAMHGAGRADAEAVEPERQGIEPSLRQQNVIAGEGTEDGGGERGEARRIVEVLRFLRAYAGVVAPFGELAVAVGEIEPV